MKPWDPETTGEIQCPSSSVKEVGACTGPDEDQGDWPFPNRRYTQKKHELTGVHSHLIERTPKEPYSVVGSAAYRKM